MLPNPTFFGYQFEWFSSLTNLGVLFATVVMILRYKYWKSFGLFPALLFFIPLFIIGDLGSKCFEALEAMLTNYNDNTTNQFDFWKMLTGKQGGRRWYGTVITASVAIYLYIKTTGKTKVFALLDEFLIAVSGGVVIGKLGCFLSGHGCYGIPSNLPWAMRVPYGIFPSALPVHPTALYDAIVYAILFIVLWRYSKHKKYNGQLILIFLFVICIASILIEVIRINDSIIFQLSMAQMIYLLLLAGTFIFYKKLNKRNYFNTLKN